MKKIDLHNPFDLSIFILFCLAAFLIILIIISYAKEYALRNRIENYNNHYEILQEIIKEIALKRERENQLLLQLEKYKDNIEQKNEKEKDEECDDFLERLNQVAIAQNRAVKKTASKLYPKTPYTLWEEKKERGYKVTIEKSRAHKTGDFSVDTFINLNKYQTSLYFLLLGAYGTEGIFSVFIGFRNYEEKEMIKKMMVYHLYIYNEQYNIKFYPSIFLLHAEYFLDKKIRLSRSNSLNEILEDQYKIQEEAHIKDIQQELEFYKNEKSSILEYTEEEIEDYERYIISKFKVKCLL